MDFSLAGLLVFFFRCWVWVVFWWAMRCIGCSGIQPGHEELR